MKWLSKLLVRLKIAEKPYSGGSEVALPLPNQEDSD